MKIILLKDIKSLGKKDDIKEVKDGYGKFLITSGSAVSYTKKSNEILSNQIKEKSKEVEDLIRENTDLKNKLEKLNLDFKVKVGKNNKMFGTITAKMISEKLKTLGFDIDKKKIECKDLNTLGEFNININLYKKIIAKIKVIVS